MDGVPPSIPCVWLTEYLNALIITVSYTEGHVTEVPAQCRAAVKKQKNHCLARVNSANAVCDTNGD